MDYSNLYATSGWRAISGWRAVHRKLSYMLLALLIFVGFSLRLDFIRHNIFHADEFISLLAISTILESGAPRFPSGQFYDKGILYSYLAAGFAALVGNEEILVRWVSLWISVLTIPLIYRIGYVLFRSKAAGLLVALVMAIYPDAMLWGGRIRMYGLTQLLYLLALFLIWLGFTQPKRAWRLAGYATFFMGLFTHLVLILTIIPLVAGFFFLPQDRRPISRPALNRTSLLAEMRILPAWPRFPAIWSLKQRLATQPKAILAEIILVITLIAALLIIGQFGFDARLAATTTLEVADEASLDFTTVAFSVLDISEIKSGLSSVQDYFFDRTSNLPLVVLAGLGLAALLFRPKPKPIGLADQTAWLLTITLLVLILEMILLLDGKWRHGRYYFLILYPLLSLLAGYGLLQLMRYPPVGLSRLGLSRFVQIVKLALLLGLGGWLIIAMLSESFKEINEPFKKYRYDLGWQYVAGRLEPEDTTIAAWPMPAYLYNHKRLDYYANQKVPVVVTSPDTHNVIDKYAGARFIATVSEFNDVLAQPGRSWFVVEDGRLFNFFEPEFVDEIFHQMEWVKSFDNIHVFVEKEGRWPLARNPTTIQPADLSGQVKFVGYAFQPAAPGPGQPILLTLFWQPISPIFNYKIFVHLRNAQGATVAQADFVPLEGGTADLKEWIRRQGPAEILRTGTTLWLPASLSPGAYTLWTGMYEANTLQRLPVTHDTSGENAISLGTLMLPGK